VATNFTNKQVWITGASSGIGEALAHAFADAGAGLVLSARNTDKLAQVAEACLSRGAASAKCVAIDLADPVALAALQQNLAQTVGRVDVLVNNSGISQRSTVEETHLDVYRQLMEVNFFGTVAITKMALPGMVQQGGGQVVTISSVSGKLGTPVRSGYCASKHALHGFFDSLRAETYHQGVKVLLVCPGYINTNISLNALNAVGKPTGKMDANQAGGLAPAALAQRILNAIAGGREEIYVGGKEIYGIYLKRFFPKMLSRILRKMGMPQ
jgi:short-subunit dehydrogenase